MKEEWRPVKGYEGRYCVSNLGRVKFLGRQVNQRNILGQNISSYRPGRNMSLVKHHTGYLVVSLRDGKTRKQHKVHRLVAKAFIDNPGNRKLVNHKNLIKTDNRVENLEWSTHQENCIHATSFGIGVGSRNGRSKLREEEVKQIRKELSEGSLRSEIAKKFGVNWSTVDAIHKRKNWKSL